MKIRQLDAPWFDVDHKGYEYLRTDKGGWFKWTEGHLELVIDYDLKDELEDRFNLDYEKKDIPGYRKALEAIRDIASSSTYDVAGFQMYDIRKIIRKVLS